MVPKYEVVVNHLPAYVVVHVPHDSAVIPATVREQFVLSDGELAGELARMTDHQTLALFAQGVPAQQIVRAEVSRLVVDVERFLVNEPMESRGMGAIYTLASDGTGRSLRRPITEGERQALIDAWYRPHHARLAEATQRMLDRHGRALVIDAHSFSPIPLPHESDQGTDRPDICIGTDEFHTPVALGMGFEAAFTAGGFSVRMNEPFSGALVPNKYYGIDRRVSAVMVEVNRNLYWNASSGTRNATFDEIAARIRDCLCKACCG